MDSFRRDYPKREIAVAASHTGNERKANNTARPLQLLSILNTCCSAYLSLTDANSVTATLYRARGRFSILGQERVAKGGRKHRVRNKRKPTTVRSCGFTPSSAFQPSSPLSPCDLVRPPCQERAPSQAVLTHSPARLSGRLHSPGTIRATDSLKSSPAPSTLLPHPRVSPLSNDFVSPPSWFCIPSPDRESGLAFGSPTGPDREGRPKLRQLQLLASSQAPHTRPRDPNIPKVLSA